MSDEPVGAESSLEEQLVAYLDSELDAETSRRIEELLATDPEVRLKLQQLGHTWELLDELDTPQVVESFTQSTLEMVTVAAEEDAERSRVEAPRRRRRRWAIAGGGLLAAGLAGVLAVSLLTPDPNQQLIDDFPVLENLEQYRYIDDVEFLHMLSREGLFAQEGGDGQ